jgi:aminoglycoside phosphotransferase (APT) family kinase protein
MMAAGKHARLLRALLTGLNEDLVPNVAGLQAAHSAELARKLLTRLIVEAEADPSPSPADGLAERRAREDQVAILQAATAEREKTPLLDHAELLACIRHYMPELKVKDLADVRHLPGGRSKSTILCDMLTDGGTYPIVIRKDFAESITASSVVYEYPILKAALAHGLPVPRTLWMESDASRLDGACICFEKVSGTAAGTLFASDAPPSVALELAATLGRLHMIDIEQTGIADALKHGRAADPVATALEEARAQYAAEMEPVRVMDEAFHWLSAHQPLLGGPRSFVHGDASFHNILVEDGRLTALLDWELSHAGDAAEDLAYVKHLAQHIVPWDDFMASYQEAGGSPISSLRLSYFEVWRPLGLALIAARATRQFEESHYSDLRLATIAADTMPRQLLYLAEALDKAKRRGTAE